MQIAKNFSTLLFKISLGLVIILGFILLSPVFSPKNPVMATSGIDLDATYIERIPRYFRYCVEYTGSSSHLCPGTENNKRWPDVGENITYTAHIINKGDTASTDFTYQWLVDGAVASTSVTTGVGAGSETTVQLQIPWSSSNQKIELKIDPNNQIAETFKSNNSLGIYSKDLTLSIWVETGLYNIFNNRLNLTGTYSFEDWIQAQFTKMNDRFKQTKYQAAPNGILDSVRIDKIIVADQLDNLVWQGSQWTTCVPQSPMATDENRYLIDGRWQFTDGDCSNFKGQNGDWQNYVNNFANTIDWGLIHELGHQLGMIDLYQLNFKNDPANNNGIQVTNLNGNLIDATKLPSVFNNGGLYAGGDTTPYDDSTYFESHTAAGINTNNNFRRGYYGDYLYDIPDNNYLKILDGLGNPIIGAQVALYQKDPNTNNIDNAPEITGTTDSQGLIALTNRAVTTGFTTATSHTLKNNPFGDINIVGTNGTMLVKVTQNNSEDYRWLTITDLNLAYWLGNITSATYTIKTNIDSRIFDLNNQALNKPASSNRGINPGHEPVKAVDGDKTTPNNGWMTDNIVIYPNDWWQVNLGANKELGKIIIYPNVSNNTDWCNKFHVDVSTTGQFTGEQSTVVTEISTPHAQSIQYSFPKTVGRYVRITCDTTQNWIQLQEFEVFAFVDAITPTVAITSPLNNAYVSRNTNITIKADASDNIAVTKVEFFVNNVLKCTDTTASYSCVWKVPSQKDVKYNLLAKVYDSAGNTSTNTITVTSK